MMSKRVCFFGLLFLSVVCVNASHFRGAIFTWIPSEDGSAITINFRISWRRSQTINWCNDSTIENGDLIGGEGSLVCSSGCNDTIGSLEYECTDYSEIDDWSTGRNYINYTVTSRSFSFRFSSCCWIGTLLVGTGLSWSVQATVDMSVRSDTGRINSSPTVEMPPILNFQYGCSYKIHLPVGDVDGDIIRCRWATGSTECAGVCNGFVGAVLDQDNCTITYTANESIGLYPAALQVEDFASIISTTPLSSIPLQFIVRIYNGTDCDDIPEFSQPTPKNNECFPLDVGDNFNMIIKARGPQLFHRITTLSPVGMIRSSEMKSHDSTLHYVELNITWTPVHSDAGKDHSLCFYVTDISGITSMTRCISLPVSVSGPTPLRVERVGLTNTWIIVIDQTFKRPSEPAYIKVFETDTNTEIMSVDSSNSTDVVFDPVKRQISVTFQYVFDTEEDYHVSIPSGLVEGYVSCGALSVPVDDPGFWKIEVDCGEHSIMNGAILAPNGTDYPHSVTYICNIGYDLTGADNRTCTANGTWTENEPYCKPRDCGSLPAPINGNNDVNITTYGKVVHFSCDIGYTLHGSAVRTCLETGIWNGTYTTCIIIDCGILEAPENGQMSCINTTYRSECLISCSPGYYISGVNISFCSENGIWNNSGTECIIKDCGNLTVPENGLLELNTTTYGSIAVFSCMMGFTLYGETIRRCTESGLWDNAYPECVETNCGNLTDPVNGEVFYLETTYLSTANYSCTIGYNLNGQSKTQCMATGEWSQVKPSCEIIDCGSLPEPINGNNDVNTTTYGEVVNFSCDIGYTLHGSAVRTCLETGIWNGTYTTCIIKDCGVLTAPDDGTIDISTTVYLSNVTYKCHSGFDRIGVPSRECLSNGSWSHEAPTCLIKDCGFLDGMDNGRVYLPVSTLGSVASYICNKGYHIVGDVTRICQADGTWDGEKPLCELTVCPEILPPQNGTVDYNSTLFEDEMIFSCDTGFTLFGEELVVCQKDGTWSDEGHNCTIKDCGQLLAPANGTVLMTSTTYLSTLEFRCNEGYDLLGESSLVCRDDGFWNGTTPICEIRECKRLKAPDHGALTSDGITFMSQATYSCDAGYYLFGTQTRTCLSDRNWTGSAPECLIKDCGVPLIPKDGDAKYQNTTFGSYNYYSCSSGYDLVGGNASFCTEFGNWSNEEIECTIKDCGSLSVPPNAELIANLTTYGAKALFSCKVGYAMHGSPERHCTEDGFWNNTSPKCVIKDCGSLSNPVNGEVYVPVTTYNAYALYVCFEGYHIRGTLIRKCKSDGSWDNEEPTCEQIDCGKPPPLANGEVSFNGTIYGSEAKYSCYTGYDLIGKESVICEEVDDWSDFGQSCVIRDCGPPEPPEDGNMKALTTTYQSLVTFSCSEGFDLIGDEVILCSANGFWNGSNPSCRIRDCGSLPQLRDGNIVLHTTTFKSNATYMCNPGYSLIGPDIRICLRNASWSGADPVCQIKDCHSPPVPSNAEVFYDNTTYGSISFSSCDVGHYMIGNNISVCTEDSRWNNTEIVCALKDCGNLTIPENAQVLTNGTHYGSLAIFSCNTGFTRHGDETRTCLESGNWSNDNPSCVIKDCGQLSGNITNGRVYLPSTLYGAVASYVCDAGYYVSGDVKRVCQEDGTWNGNEPSCKLTDCVQLPDPMNGRIIAESRNFGDTALYLCDPGYTLIGNDTRECLRNTTWSNTEPVCEIKDCGPLTHPENGHVHYKTTTFGSDLSVSCNEGFDLTGEAEGTCEHTGNWSIDISECRIKDCGLLQNPENGVVKHGGTVYKSEATVLCNTGYYPDVEILHCTHSGKWDGYPMCIIEDCGLLDAPEHGSVSISSTTYNSVAAFECDTGYDLIGSSYKTCQQNGTWTNEQQTSCKIRSCKYPVAPENGLVSVHSTEYKAVVTFSCDVGYILVGNQELECLEDGTWNGLEPFCEIKDCNDPMSISNGRLQFNTTTFGSIASYTCDSGYIMIGQATIECLSHGIWENRPSCEIKKCEQLQSPENGKVFVSAVTYGALAIFSCKDGYIRIGNQLSECLENSTWSNAETRCEVKDCGKPLLPTNGTVTYYNTTYESVARYSCNKGHRLKGREIIACNSDGLWNDSIPECKIKDCGFVGNLTNGEISDGNTFYGSIITFTCDDGYEILGSNESKCLANGTWSDTPPQCKFTATSSTNSSLAYWIIGGSTGFIILLISACIIAVAVSRMRRNKRKSDYWDNSTEMDNIKRIDSWQNHNALSGTSSRQSDFWSYAVRRTPIHLPRISNRFENLI